MMIPTTIAKNVFMQKKRHARRVASLRLYQQATTEKHISGCSRKKKMDIHEGESQE